MLTKVFSNFHWRSRTPTVLFQGDCLSFWCLSASQHHDWVFPVLLEMRQKEDTDLCTMVYPNCGGVLLYIVMVCHFVCNTHKVMIALIVMLPSKWCCACFPGIL
jgi:hypothetical protein